MKSINSTAGGLEKRAELKLSEEPRPTRSWNSPSGLWHRKTTTFGALLAAGPGLLATIQASLHIIGAIVLLIGVALVVVTGGTGIVVIVASLVVLAAMALFAWIVFRTAAA